MFFFQGFPPFVCLPFFLHKMLGLQVVNEAYHVLADESKRATYDKYGREGVASAEGGAADPVEIMKCELRRCLFVVVCLCVSHRGLVQPCLEETRSRTRLESSTCGKQCECSS